MLDVQDPTAIRGRQLHDRDGEKIGKVDEIYLDLDTGRPEWALVNTGLFGTSSTFVPLTDAEERGDDIRVPYEKAHVKDAPNIEPDGQLTPEQEAELYRHYGFDYAGGGREETEGRFERGTSGDDAMTRSEEELHVGTERREAGRARLRKHVVTEEVTRTVPVKREELRVEREPITDENRGPAHEGPAISEGEHEVVLREEEPVVEKRAVPKERVRLDKDTVAEERTVDDEVRKERIELDDDNRRR